MSNRAYSLALSKINGLGPVKYRKLIDYFGDAKKAWEGNLTEWKEALGGTPKIFKEITEFKKRFDIFEYEASVLTKGINYLTIDDNLYPKSLREIYDSPTVIFYKGTIREFSLNIAIVGSRSCSYYGREVAKHLAGQLAGKGINVVSGMARGIDSCAHIGALENFGYTTAVLGSGIDVIYPPENRKLAQKIAEEGVLLSEYHPGTPPDAVNFPARNRIISGLAQGVIVIEAAEKSGSLITVDFALEQGKEVFAVPGNINHGKSEGTNNLIKQGAKIVMDINCILEEFNLFSETQIGDETSLTAVESLIMKSLTDGPIFLDDLTDRTGLNTEELNSFLTIMEIKGLINQLPGKKIVKKSCFRC